MLIKVSPKGLRNKKEGDVFIGKGQLIRCRNLEPRGKNLYHLPFTFLIGNWGMRDM